MAPSLTAKDTDPTSLQPAKRSKTAREMLKLRPSFPSLGRGTTRDSVNSDVHSQMLAHPPREKFKCMSFQGQLEPEKLNVHGLIFIPSTAKISSFGTLVKGRSGGTSTKANLP